MSLKSCITEDIIPVYVLFHSKVTAKKFILKLVKMVAGKGVGMREGDFSF